MKGYYARIVSDHFLSIEELTRIAGGEFFACHSRLGGSHVIELACPDVPTGVESMEPVRDIERVGKDIQDAGGVCVSGGRIVDYWADPPGSDEIELSHPRAPRKKIVS